MTSKRSHSTQPRKRISLIGTLLCLLSMLILIPAPPAQAFVLFPNMNLATWNSLGQNWSSVSTILRNGHNRPNDLVVIQEAGPRPAEMQDMGVVAEQVFGNATYQVRRYRWEVSGQATYQVYWMNGNASNGGRVNFAIVTTRMAHSILIAPPPRLNTRPSFGVRFFEDYYFNVHAPSPNNGQDAAQILVNISATVANSGGYNWTAIGDFNVNPGSLQPFINGAWPRESTRPQIYEPGVPTQDSGGTLDYMVSSHRIPGVRMVRDGQIGSSDHYPVYNEFNLSGGGEEYYIRSNKYPDYTMQPNSTPYAGDPVVIGYPSSPFDEFVFGMSSKSRATVGATATGTTIREADSGLCLDPQGYVSKVKAKLEVYPCSGSADQTFTMDPGGAGGAGTKSMMIRHDLSGLCLSVFESSTSAEPTWIGLDNCSQTINQRFAIIV